MNNFQKYLGGNRCHVLTVKGHTFAKTAYNCSAGEMTHRGTLGTVDPLP